MDDVGGTVKNIVFHKVKSGFVTIDSPFEFHQAILKFVSSIKSVYLPDTDILNDPKSSILIEGTRVILNLFIFLQEDFTFPLTCLCRVTFLLFSFYHNLLSLSQPFFIITIFVHYHNLFQSSQSFSIITIFSNH